MRKIRPGWRIDAKWTCGVLLTVFLIPTLMVCSLYQATAREPAKKVVVPLIREVSGIDRVSEEAFEQLFKVAQLNPGEKFEIPGWLVKLSLLGRDIAGKTEEKLKNLVLKRTFDLVYEQGFEAPPESPPEVSMAAVVINFFSEANHQRLGSTLGWLFTICVILTIPLVLFSFRFGKLISVGVSLIFAALPASILSLILSKTGVGSENFLTELVEAVLPFIWGIHLKALLVGLGFALVGVLVGTIFWFLSEGRETKIVERSLPR